MLEKMTALLQHAELAIVAARAADVLWPACSRLQAECKHLELELGAVPSQDAEAAEEPQAEPQVSS